MMLHQCECLPLLQLLTMNIMTKLMALVILGAPFIVVGGLLYKQASGSTWREAMFKSYTVLQNVPGKQPNCVCSLMNKSRTKLAFLVARLRLES